MSGNRQVAIAVYHRDKFSDLEKRKIYKYMSFHWGVLIIPEQTRGRVCQAYEATDASYMDKKTMRMVNPSMDWWFNHRKEVDPELSGKFLGCIVIGNVPSGKSDDEVHELFKEVPMPVKHTEPQQSCVTWVEDVIGKLQKNGWVSHFDVNSFKDLTMSYADRRRAGKDARMFVRYAGGDLAGI